MTRTLTITQATVALAMLLASTIAEGQWRKRRVGTPFHRYNNLGVGVTLGTLDGFSAYFRPSPEDFVQAGVAFRVQSQLFAHGDYCAAYPNLIRRARSVVPYYCLGGVVAQLSDGWGRQPSHNLLPEEHRGDVYIGAHVPIGAQFFVRGTPIMLGGEISPGIFVVPKLHQFLKGQIIARVTF